MGSWEGVAEWRSFALDYRLDLSSECICRHSHEMRGKQCSTLAVGLGDQSCKELGVLLLTGWIVLVDYLRAFLAHSLLTKCF